MSFWQELNARLQAFGLAVAIHVLMAALVVVGTMDWKPFRKTQPVGLTIEAVIVDTSAIREQREEAKRAQEREELRQRRAEQLEQQRLREEELAREREQQRQQELEEQRKRDAQDRLTALRLERERKLEEERLKQQRELQQLRAQREAAERQRRLEEERLKQLEARRQNEAEEQRRRLEDAERQRQAEAQQREFRAGQLATKEQEYTLAIQAVVTQNWLRPPTAQAGLRCTLKIAQIPGGEVVSAAISGRCNGDEATRRSIVAAVERVGVLPYRGYEDVFKREIDFIFIYDGD
jgi:colicin import membrane protein